MFSHIHYLAVKCLSKNHKLVRSIFWGSFRNHKAVRDMLREKSPSSSAPLHFVASTLRSISRESLVNLGQWQVCGTVGPDCTVSCWHAIEHRDVGGYAVWMATVFRIQHSQRKYGSGTIAGVAGGRELKLPAQSSQASWAARRTQEQSPSSS